MILDFLEEIFKIKKTFIKACWQWYVQWLEKNEKDLQKIRHLRTEQIVESDRAGCQLKCRISNLNAGYQTLMLHLMTVHFIAGSAQEFDHNKQSR